MQNVHPRKKYMTFTLATAISTAAIFGVVAACTNQQATAKPNIVHKEQAPQPNVVAKIGDQMITEEELIGEDKLDFFDLKKREYELKMNRLRELMTEKLIGSEAKKANMSLDDFINKKVVKGEIKISDKEYKKFVEEKKIPESQLNPQIKERITNYLQTQKRQDMIDAYVAKLTKKNPVEAYFTKPKMSVEVATGEAPVMGKKDAPVQIVEFSDFQCPFCGRAADTVNEIKKKYGNKVAVYFKHFPLPMHREAGPASEASMCVHEQNPDKFWKFHDIIFKNQDQLSNDDLAKYAKQVGADEKKFKECFDSKKYAEFVRKDMEQGEKIGVRSTPTFFINGQLVSGAVPLETFSEIIDEELADAKK